MKATHSISAAAFLLGTGILLSRVLGYARDMLLADKFGAGATTDAFYAAFQIPDLLNYFLSGGALSIAFIPLYHKVLARDGKDVARDMASAVLGTLGIVATFATLVLWCYAPELIRFQFPKFDEETTAHTVHLTRIVLPAQVFFITGGIVQAVLLAQGHFRVAAISPLIYNLCIIAGGYFLYPIRGIDGFAFGTLAGSMLGPFLLPVLYSQKHAPLRLRFTPRDRNFLVYLALAAPLMLGQTLLTIDEWYGRWFGALLPSGTVAHLSYARKLMQVPVAVIGQAIAAAALPTLSRLWAEGRVEEMNAKLSQTLNTGLSLAVLAGGAFFAMAQPAIALVYQHGAFNAKDTASVAALLATFAFAMPAWITQQISVRAFYARGDTWRPMTLGTILTLLAIPLYIVMSDRAGARGIALAGVVAMSINAAATLLLARRLHNSPAIKPLLLSLVRSAAITCVASLAAMGTMRARHALYPDTAADWSPKFSALLDGAAGGAAFTVIALIGVFLFGEEGLRRFVARVFRKDIDPQRS